MSGIENLAPERPEDAPGWRNCMGKYKLHFVDSYGHRETRCGQWVFAKNPLIGDYNACTRGRCIACQTKLLKQGNMLAIHPPSL